jgi:hypothetical protein
MAIGLNDLFFATSWAREIFEKESLLLDSSAFFAKVFGKKRQALGSARIIIAYLKQFDMSNDSVMRREVDPLIMFFNRYLGLDTRRNMIAAIHKVDEASCKKLLALGLKEL